MYNINDKYKGFLHSSRYAGLGRNDTFMLIQILTIIAVLYLLSRVGGQFKRKQITGKEALFWALVWFAVGVVVLYPKLTDRLASGLGLQSAKGIDLVVYAGVAVVFYLVFRIFIRLDRMERVITTIVRHLALKAKEADEANKEKGQ